MPKSLIGAFVFLIALGLVLRWSKGANALLSSSFTGVNNLVGALSLSKFTGSSY